MMMMKVSGFQSCLRQLRPAAKNRKYINLNCHQTTGTSNCNFTNLGLSRARGSLATLIQEHLNQFEINIYRDVVALVTDAASVIKCVGQQFECLHLLCICHGIHLAVMDVLYPKKRDSEKDFFQRNEESESEDENDDERMTFDHVESAEETESQAMIPQYHSLIQKAGRTCKVFCKSSVKNDNFLQKCMVGWKISLKLDCKTC